ncbi:conserved hypothetical protein [Coccidioides posadasii str. Silveira]|uniref:Uncharacterized protein n=1 Tax=Coccidioides posadasii (strain RMSCC 757 / Silveira) TaxID=443226 RepID=E9DHU0_COCPS|nr:conserved hypothetical protein [Coccidioides posadasii str. Silveira]
MAFTKAMRMFQQSQPTNTDIISIQSPAKRMDEGTEYSSPIERPPISAHFVRFSRFREVVNTSGESQYSQFGSNSVQRPLSSECVYVLPTYIHLSSLPAARMKENCQTIIAVDVQLPLSYQPTTGSNESYPHGITYAMDLDESIHRTLQPLNAAEGQPGSHCIPIYLLSSQSTYNRYLFAIGAQNPCKITWIEVYENTRDLQFCKYILRQK